MNQNKRTQNVFPLSDTLQMDMRYYFRSDTIYGRMELDLPVGKELLPLSPKIMWSFVDDYESAVLVKIRKRVWLFLRYIEASHQLTCQVLDGHILDLHENHGLPKKGELPDRVSNHFARGTKATFTQNVASAKWKDVNEFVDSLDIEQRITKDTE
jgi:hypothetical protein